MSAIVQKHLAAVKCHFQWKPDQNDMPENIKMTEQKLLQNIKENEKIEIFALTFLSYIFATGNTRGRDIDFDKALKYADDAIKKSTSKGDTYVAIANKMHIYDQQKETAQVEQLCKTMLQYDELTRNDQCRVNVIHAFALTQFGMKGYEKAVAVYRNGLKLDDECPDAHFGLGMVLGKIRRYKNNLMSEPCQAEMQALKRACDLWQNKDATSLVWYGYAKLQYLTFAKEHECHSITEIAELFEMAESLANKSGASHVYTWCAKGYKRLCQFIYLPNLIKQYRKKQKECVDKAVALNPSNTSAHHEAGILYWRSRDYKNAEQARSHLEKACQCAPPSGNFWADVDYVRFKKDVDSSRDSVIDYVKLLRKYQEYEHGMKRKVFLASLHMYTGKELDEKGNKEKALDEYMQALQLDKTTARVEDAKVNAISILCTALNEIPSNQEKVHLLTKLGHVCYITQELSDAKQHYEEILSLDSSNEIAQERLCETHFELKEYDDCILRGSAFLDRFPRTDMQDILAKSYFRVGMARFDSNRTTAKDNLCNSAELGLLDAGQKLLDILKEQCYTNKDLALTQAAYEQSAKLYGWYTRSDGHYSCEKPDITSDVLKQNAGQISNAARQLALTPLATLHPDLKTQANETRKLCFDMTVQKVMPKQDEISTGIDAFLSVLDQAKCQLDGCFFTLKKNRREFCSTTKRGYYPFTPLPKPNDPEPGESEESLNTTRAFLKQKLETDMKLINFSTVLPDLFDSLCKRQARYSTKYYFVPEFCRIVNEKKHENRCDGPDYFYGLAHSACFHAEELAIELSKYMFPM